MSKIRERRTATRCAACSSIPGSAPYRTRSAASRTDAPPSPAPMPCDYLGRRLGAVPIEQATLARLHRHLPGDIATPVLRALVHTLVARVAPCLVSSPCSSTHACVKQLRYVRSRRPLDPGCTPVLPCGMLRRRRLRRWHPRSIFRPNRPKRRQMRIESSNEPHRKRPTNGSIGTTRNRSSLQSRSDRVSLIKIPCPRVCSGHFIRLRIRARPRNRLLLPAPPRKNARSSGGRIFENRLRKKVPIPP